MDDTLTWQTIRLEAVAPRMSETIDPRLLGDRVVEHYSIPSLEKTGKPEAVLAAHIRSGKQLLRGGEVMVSRLNPRKARVIAVPTVRDVALASGEFVILAPLGIEPRFLTYVLLNEEVRQYLDSRVQSVTRSHQRVRPEVIMTMQVRVPGPSEQRAVAAFLDRETARVDDLVGQQEQLLERLAEYRTALIANTVTRGLPPEAAIAAGLDPHPHYRDSGVEWLGRIPEHWEARELGRMGSFFKGKGGTKKDAIEGGVPCIRYGDLFSYEYHIRSSRAGIPKEKTSDYRLIEQGDVLFAGSSVAPKRIGKSAVNLIAGTVYCGGDVIVFRPLVDTDARFMGYAAHSHPSASQKLTMSRVVTVAHIYGAQLQHMVLPIPPLEEQRAIATFLDRRMTKLDELVSQVEGAVERLLEYRSALITHAVTGKMDVRGSVAHAGAGGR